MVSNLILSTKKLLNLLDIRNTKEFIEDNLISHADYPSLLSISDTLHKYNIESLAFNVDKEKLQEIPLPCIVQVSVEEKPLFYVLTKYDLDMVSYYNEINKLCRVPTSDFLDIWTGICLAAETSEKSEETYIKNKLAKKRVFNILKISLIICLTSWILLILTTTSVSLFPLAIVYSLLKIVGLVLATLLLWFEVDKYNPTLQNFCSGGKKVNCDSVLGSKYASLFNGTISLGSIGFSYFFASFLYLLFNSFSEASFSMLSIFSFLSLPAVAISIYYQAVVLKQWCKFCIGIQLVLVSEIIVGYFGVFYISEISLTSLPALLALFLIPILIWMLIKPLLEKVKTTNFYRRSHQKIKNDPNVLDGLLIKSRKLETNTHKGLGITFKQDNAKYDIIKVCNPYCGPCARAHPILEELLEQGKINLQILFTASSSESDRGSKPVRHFLALDEKNTDSIRTKKALDDWYLSEKKDYDIFASKYPMNGELEKQTEKLEAMYTWCRKEKIRHTPSIFINGYELPQEYSVQDLINII